MSQDNFNRAPYFDDFNSESNYARVLFKDDTAIQTRELNNVQSGYQNQIRMFGEHVFKNGSRVAGARMSTHSCDFIAIDSSSPFTGLPVDWTTIKTGWVLHGRVTQLKANITHVEQPSALNHDRIMLYVAYNGSAIDGETHAFLPGESIDFMDENGNVFYTVNVRCPSCDPAMDQSPSTGKGTLFTVEDGVFFFNGMFIDNENQTTVISHELDIAAAGTDVHAGFKVVRRIVTSAEDGNLNDISLGYANTASPGADRYSVTLELGTKTDTDAEFITLASWMGGEMSYFKPSSEYSVIEDELARRTHEESGNYTVGAYDISFMEHLKTDGAPGLTTTGSADNFVIKLSPATHYVLGRRVSSTSSRYVVASKARQTQVMPAYAKNFNEMSYIIANPRAGSSAYPGARNQTGVNDGSLIELYDGPLNVGPGGSFLPTGSKIGTMRVFDMSIETGTPGADDATYRYYHYDLVLNANKTFADVESLFHPTHKFVASMVKDSGKNISRAGTNKGLIWTTGKSHVKSLRDAQNSSRGSLTYTTRAKATGRADSQGTITFGSNSDEMFVDFSDKTVLIVETDGVPVTIDHSLADVTILTSGVTIKLGSGSSGKIVTLITDTIKTKMPERQKRLRVETDTITLIDVANSMNLSKADAVKITSIMLYRKLDQTQTGTSIDTSTFMLSNGQTDYYYGNASFKIAAGKSLPADVVASIGDFGLRVTYEYMDHSRSDGFLNVDSYRELIDSGFMQYDDVPVHVSSSTGEAYSLASCLDFRPLMIDGAIIASAAPSMNEMAFFDIEYYVPRIDLLQVNADGSYVTIKGQANDSPIPPKPSSDAMALAEIHIPAYVYNPVDVRHRKIETKRYTMKDIGRLANRLRNVEYYTSLNLLELSAKDASIKDGNGLDKFKNGFIVDDFSEFQAADVNSPEFKAANDTGERTLRPSFGNRNRKLKLMSVDDHMVVRDGVIMRSYTETVADKNLNATKSMSLNPYHIFTRVGKVSLSPNIDTWADTTVFPEQIITQDFGTDAYAQAARRMDSMWGSWRTNNIVAAEPSAAELQSQNSGTVTRNGNVDSISMGSRLTDMAISPYMRENVITFTCTGMSKNTIVYPFFNKKEVWKFCRPMNGVWGDDLVTNDSGELIGQFRIPPQTFFSGEKKFKITSSPTNSNDPDGLLTTASCTYYSAGIDLGKQSLTFNAVKPELDSSSFVSTPSSDKLANTDAVVTKDATNTVVNGFVEVPDKMQQVSTGGTAMFGVSKDEPVAQSFYLDADAFVTSIDLYFAQIDEKPSTLWLELRPTSLGVPAQTVLARAELPSSSVVVSRNASVATRITFATPVFVKANEHYAFVLGGSSPLHRVWVSRVGDKLIDAPGRIMETQVSLGTSFRSQNGITWSEDQWEDMKYSIQVAQFIDRDFTATFEIDNTEHDFIGIDALESQAGESVVRVHAKDHACAVGDYIKLTVLDDVTIVVDTAGSSAIMIDDAIKANDNGTSFTGSARVTAVVMSGALATITLRDITGTFATADIITRAGTVCGNVTSATLADLNGISVNVLNRPVAVIAVDSKDTFVVDVIDVASVSGRFGGSVKCHMNVPYDTYNICGSVMAYDGNMSCKLNGVAHNHYQSADLPFNDYADMAGASFDMNTDVSVSQTHKIVSSLNDASKKTTVQLSVISRNASVSAAMSMGTLSMILVNNRISKETTRMDVAPLAFNRWVDETHAGSGVESFKYVTRVVSFTKPAEDALIMIDAHRPAGTDFKLFFRRNGAADETRVTELEWVEIPISKKIYNSKDEFTEYEVYLSQVFASTWATEDFMSNIQFKITGTSENSAVVPKFKNLRIIAVT